jgi:hypothetical protein
VRRALLRAGALALILGAAWAAPAAACPQCAGRGGIGAAGLAAIAGVVLLPYGIAAVVIPAVRRGPAGSRHEEP